MPIRTATPMPDDQALPGRLAVYVLAWTTSGRPGGSDPPDLTLSAGSPTVTGSGFIGSDQDIPMILDSLTGTTRTSHDSGVRVFARTVRSMDMFGPGLGLNWQARHRDGTALESWEIVAGHTLIFELGAHLLAQTGLQAPDVPVEANAYIDVFGTGNKGGGVFGAEDDDPGTLVLFGDVTARFVGGSTEVISNLGAIDTPDDVTDLWYGVLSRFFVGPGTPPAVEVVDLGSRTGRFDAFALTVYLDPTLDVGDVLMLVV